MTSAAPASGAPEIPAPGELVAGKYRVTRVLGRGGMGCVVAAQHELLNQQVAIKFLLPHAAADEQFIGRFLREAQTAATLRSEHVVRVLDVGTTPSGAPYMVMEYLDGMDLGARVDREGPLPISDAVDYILQACEALAEAHATGLVHRDIKPPNLFLARRSDGSPLVKVLDFGIAKAPSAASIKLTSTGMTMGSPCYMSPEQIRDFRAVDARSDVWSLGATLHELLTGSPPFAADSFAGLCVAVATEPPTPLRAARPDAPVGLEKVLHHCLQKLPARRIPDVGALARELLPYASPRAEISVERIHRLLAGATDPSRSSGSPLEASSSGSVGASTTVLGSSGVTAPRRPSTLLIGLAAGLAAGLLAVAFLLLRGSGDGATANPDPTAAAPSALPAASPAVSPAPQAEATPSGPAPQAPGAPAASAPASAASLPAVTPAPTPSAPRTAAPATAPAPTRNAGNKHADPFAEQH